jgi:N-acetylglucosaminyl-diphospho-decaprenol L-rhamnosyltransferase
MPIGPPPKDDADVSVVLVATNARADVERNVEQLRAQEGVALEVVVVDNGSTDGTREFLEQQPDLLLIANTENQWLNPARIQGLAHVTAPLIMFFAPDTAMPPDTVLRLKEALDSDPQVGLVGPRLFGQHGHDMVNGQFPYPTVRWVVADALGLADRMKRNVLPPAHSEAAAAEIERTGYEDVPFVNGSLLLMRRETLDAIGGLDPRFYFDWEELDLARRVYKAGYKVRLVPGTNVMHRGKGTPVLTGLREKIFLDAERLYFRKHHGAPAAALVWTARTTQKARKRLRRRSAR